MNLIFRALILVVFIFVLQSTHARAQATRTWVSGVGDDVNPCSRTAPCKTFAGAISKTVAGGEINCIDPGGFGAVTITKSLIIDCSNTEAGVVVAGTNGIVISAAAGDVVVLRGLDIVGTIATPALNGIVFNTGAALIVEKCTIRQFQAASPNGNGILFKPGASSRLLVSDTSLTNSGSGTSGAAISVKPAGTSPTRVTISRSYMQDNANGILIDGSGSTDRTFVEVNNSVVASSASFGISGTTSGGHTTNVLVDSSSIVHNSVGISTTGAVFFLRNSSVMGNDTGLKFTAPGQIISYQNNTINSNVVDGAPSSTHAPD